MPKVNPFRWMKAQNGTQDYFTNEVSPFESPSCYVNPFQLTDPLNAQMQFLTTYVSSYKIELIDFRNNVYKTASTQIMNTDSDHWRYVHFNLIPGATLTEGIYYLRLSVTLTTGQVDYYITEPIDLRATWENTLAIDYGNAENDFDMIWNRSGLTARLSRIDSVSSTRRFSAIYRLRLFGGYWSKDYVPSSDDVVYNNQVWDFQTVSSIPYDVRKVTFGDGRGIPNYIANILNRIFSCTYIKINGEQVNKIEGAKIEQSNRPDKSPLSGWTIDVAKASNDYADEYSFVKTVTPSGIGYYTIGFDFVVS